MIAVGTVRSKGGSKFAVGVGENGSLTITDVLAVGAEGVLNMSDFIQEDIDALKKAASENWAALFSDYDSADETTPGTDFATYDEFTVNFANGGKEYRDVNKIVLGNMVSFFSAEGWQFPNVSSVSSEAFRFMTTSIEKQGFAGIVYTRGAGYLICAFQHRNVIDLSVIGSINTNAFPDGTDTSVLTFTNVSPALGFFSLQLKGGPLSIPSNNEENYGAFSAFRKDSFGTYWYGNIAAGTDKDADTMKIDRKDAQVLTKATKNVKHFEMPDTVLLRMAEIISTEDDGDYPDKDVCLHITQETSKQLKEISRDGSMPDKWGYVASFVSDCDAYADEEGVLYTKDFKKLIMCPPNLQAKTDTLYIHEGTEIIGREAFRFANIKRIIMPDSVKHLESSAFSYCFAKYIKLSGGLSAIENETMALPGQFQGCDNLKKVSIPASVKYIADESFYNCLGLEEVKFEEGAAETIGRGAFHNTKIKSVELPKSCKRVGECAFATPHGMVAAHAGTKGVAGSAYNGRFEYTNIPARFALIKDNGERQELLVPVEVLRSEKVRAGIDIAFCEGNIPCALSELIFNTAMDRIQGTYNKSRLALMAVSQYGSTNGHIIKYLKKAGPYLAERFIGDGNVKELSELLHMHLLPDKALEKLLSISSGKGNVEGAALIAEEIRRKNTRKKTEIML